MMKSHFTVYRFSAAHGPPPVSLRDGRIADDYGNDSFATHPIDHQRPEDVTAADLDAYRDVFAFLDLPSLYFYLWPVAMHYEANPELDCRDSYLWSLEGALQSERPKRKISDYPEALREGLEWIYLAHDEIDDSLMSCPRLQAIIGLLDWSD